MDELAFIAAEPREFDGLLRRITEIRTEPTSFQWFRRGLWRRRPVVLIANGAGPARSGEAARACGCSAAIINIGFCGALISSLGIGDVIVADRVYFRDQAFDCKGITTPRTVSRGPVLSHSRIAATASEKEHLRKTGAIAVEMEAGAIAAFARDAGIGFYCVRSVSDLAAESFANDFNAVLGPDGRFRVGPLVGRAFLKPFTRLPELMRLKRRCDRASEELGDFLDSCSF